MTTESRQNINENDEISLKEVILQMQQWCKFLFSKWLIILFFGLLGGSLGFAYAYNKEPVYIATTTFVLEDESGGGGGLGGLGSLASIAGIDLGGAAGGIFQGDNLLELYKSRKMLQQTLLTTIKVNGKQQLLIDRYLEFNEIRERWAEKPELLRLHFAVDTLMDGNFFLKPNRLRDSVLTFVVSDLSKNYLSVSKPDKKLSIVEVYVKAKDELFAKEFNETIVKNVNDFYLQTKTKKSLQNVQIMQGKVDSVRGVMNGSIYAAVAIADATPNLNPTRQVQRVVPAQRAQFSAETNKAILNSLVQNLEMSKLALMNETPLLEVIDQPVYPLKKEKFGKVKGIVLGGILGGFIVCLVLVLRRIFKLILA